MNNTKYGKYFIRGPKPGSWDQTCVVQMDDEVIPGSFFFHFTFLKPGFGTNRSHGPHQHNTGEIIGWFGTDSDNPLDLGAEIVVYMGEEMESHLVNQSTLLFIPPMLVHCPVVYNRIDKPIIHIFSMHQALLQKEARKDLVSRVPEEHRSNLFFPHQKE